MFAGILCLDDSNSPADLLGSANLLPALYPKDPPAVTSSYHDGPFLLQEAIASGRSAPADLPHTGAVPYRCQESGRMIAFWGRLDNRAGLASELGRPPSAQDHDLVLAAFGRWGPSCAQKLSGDFSAAIYTPTARRVVLIRDPIGAKPLYYRIESGFLIFATTAAVFPRLRRPIAVPDQDWMARMLAGTYGDEIPTATGWAGVVKLTPGHWLDVRPGNSQLRRYHFWNDNPPWTTRRCAKWVDTYRDVLEEAIGCRARDVDLAGTENSGGVDSSTVTAYLARYLRDAGDHLHAFGFALQEKESEYILETSRHAGIRNNYMLTVMPTLTDADIRRGLAAVGYPEQQDSAIAHIPFYEECGRRGIRTLFSGFGGDEAVTNSGSLLGRELIDHRAYPTLWRLLPGSPLARTLGVVRAVNSGARWGAGHPALWAVSEARWRHQLVREPVVRRLGLLDRYRQAAAFDAPYRRINDFVLDNRLGPWVARRLETCTLVAAGYGVEYRWPLLDPRLIQQFLSTPSIEKADRQAGRYLHRRAIEGVVAPKVAWMPGKSIGGQADHTAAGALRHQWAGPAQVWHARRQRAHLHPAIAELIDLARFNDQIAAATNGQLDDDAAFQFSENVARLRWLNHWLSGGAPPE